MQAGWRQPYGSGMANPYPANYGPRGGAVPYNNPNPWATSTHNPWAAGSAGPSGWAGPNVQPKQRIYQPAHHPADNIDDPYEIKPSSSRP